jgi:hypothetical protein
MNVKPFRAISTALRAAAGVVILAFAALCVFGFAATFEPNSWWIVWSWRLGYAGLGMVAVITGLRLLRDPAR